MASPHTNADPVEKPPMRPQALLIAVLGPLIVATLISCVYLSAFHEPKPNGMKVDIVGSTSQAQGLATQLNAQPGGRIDADVVTTRSEAVTNIKSLDARAAYEPSTGKLLVASAGSTLATQTVTQTFQQVADQSHTKLVVEDLHPLPKQDNSGSTYLFLGLGGILAGFMTANVLGSAAPELSTGKTLALLAGMSITGGVVATFITFGVYGAYTEHLLPAILFASGGGLATALFQYGGSRLLGPAAVVFTMGILIIPGIAASGASMPIDMLPSYLKTVSPMLPTSAAIDGLHRLLYFDGVGISRPISTIVMWLLFGGWLVAVSQSRAAKKNSNAADEKGAVE